MNEGDCSVDSDGIVVCTCKNNWLGQFCDLTEQAAQELVSDMNRQLDTISSDSSQPLSNEIINNLKQYQSIIASKPDYVTNELTNKISELAQSQIELMMTGQTATNPNLINLLDFSLDLTM